MMDRLVFYRFPRRGFLAAMGRCLLEPQEAREEDFFHALSEMTSFGVRHGLSGNLWQASLAAFMVLEENPYSIACEQKGSAGETLDAIALRDFSVLRRLFGMSLRPLFSRFTVDPAPYLDFVTDAPRGTSLGRQMRERVRELTTALAEAKTDQAFAEAIRLFYRDCGVGDFGLHKAFRLDTRGRIRSIAAIPEVAFSDLVGLGRQKQLLCDNTEAFLYGYPANNCLLYGDAGTGKSSCIKALANRYYDSGLRIIEIYKHQLSHLPAVIAAVKNRNYLFILYMDDLSFEEHEVEYKYLKAVIEGGLEKTPDNLLIYATSNRRHLVRESMSDNREYDDLHKNDTKQEKLSLSRRFGLSLYFGSPDPKEYLKIVRALAERDGLQMDEETLTAGARQWEMKWGGLSGRTARQFVDSELARQMKERGQP